MRPTTAAILIKLRKAGVNPPNSAIIPILRMMSANAVILIKLRKQGKQVNNSLNPSNIMLVPRMMSAKSLGRYNQGVLLEWRKIHQLSCHNQVFLLE